MNMTRGNYFAFNFLFNVMLMAMEGSYIVLFVCVIMQMVFLMPGRCDDIGMSKWWILTTIIPGLNLYSGFMLTFAPTGYKKTDHANFKKIDGVMMFGFVIITLLFIFALNIFVLDKF